MCIQPLSIKFEDICNLFEAGLFKKFNFLLNLTI